MGVLRPVDHACLEHVVVWLDSVEAWQLELVITEQLAVRELWVGGKALLGQGRVAFKDLELVDISRSEFCRIEVIVKEATCLPDSGDERAADIGAAVPRFFSIVNPAILLDNSHNFFD